MGHISFDFAHSLEYPHRAHECMDEFIMPKIRVNIIGVVNEATGEKTSFLFHDPGRSNPSAVISMLHNYLKHQVPQLSHVELLVMNANSCAAQNKNNAMVSFRKSRIAAGRHKQVIMRFMVKGHTRFSVDAGFGNVRSALNKYVSASLKDNMRVIGNIKSEKTVNFMKEQLYSFEELRKLSKDVPNISKACEIDFFLVEGNLRVYVRDEHKNDVSRHDKGYLRKEVHSANIDEFLQRSDVLVHHKIRSVKRHTQLTKDVVPHLYQAELDDFW